MSLDEAIREAASNGRFDGLTLWASDRGWQANARPTGGQGWIVATHPDPIQALLDVLGERPAPQPNLSVFD